MGIELRNVETLQSEQNFDVELDLESRFLLAGGVKRALVQSNRTMLAVYGGLDYALEDYDGVPGHDDCAEALAAIEWDWFEVGGKTELPTQATTFFSLERSRARIELTASLRRSFFSRFYWSLNLLESYDRDPPADFENSDFGLSFHGRKHVPIRLPPLPAIARHISASGARSSWRGTRRAQCVIA